MKKISKLLVIPFGVLLFSNVSSASMLDQVIYNVVGQASNAAGARLGDEIYYGSSRGSSRGSTHRKVRRKHKKHRKAKRYVPAAPVMTNERRIQQTLTSLGFYHGKIDGQINSFESRTAIKNMNIAYGISNDASLRQEVRDNLIYLGNLFELDRYLISSSNTSKSKNKKIQAALKVHGYYHSSIDGLLGRGSRSSIREYQMGAGLATTGSLDFEAEYQLVSSAKEKNDQNLNSSINSLKSFGNQRATQQGYQQRQPMQQYQAPVQQQYQPPVQQQKQYQAPVQQQQQPMTYKAPVNNAPTPAVQQNVPQATTTQLAQPVNNTTTLDASSIEMYTDKK